jgi:hypothetical protein
MSEFMQMQLLTTWLAMEMMYFQITVQEVCIGELKIQVAEVLFIVKDMHIKIGILLALVLECKCLLFHMDLTIFIAQDLSIPGLTVLFLTMGGSLI